MVNTFSFLFRFLKEKFSFFLDAEVRATLNSYQYLKKLLHEKLDRQNQLVTMAFVC